MVNFEIIGYLAGFIVALSLLPQVTKAWITKSTKDISVSWTFVYVLGFIFWVIYGFGIGSLPLMIAVTIEAIMGLILLILKLRYN